MPKFTIIEHSGSEHVVEAPVGQSVMQAAVSAGIPNFFADCGGDCVCGNCHCYVDAAWQEQIPAAQGSEKDTLEWRDHVQDNSRLTCQIVLTEALDGIVIRLPEPSV